MQSQLLPSVLFALGLAVQAPFAIATPPGAPDMTISKGHSGNFTTGDVGDTYSLFVTNSGTKPSSGTVTVIDTLPNGLTATAIGGSGWGCTLATLTCTRSDALASGTSYPVVVVTVNVASNAPPNVVNQASVSGGGETITSNDSASDPTTINQKAPDLSIDVFHSGTWSEGDVGKTYSLRVDNSNIYGAATDGSTVTVVDTLPAGLTATAIAGPGWTCTLATLTCTRSDVLANFTTYPWITLTVDVARNAATPLINSATVSGGGDTNTVNNSWGDSTDIVQKPDLAIAKSHSGIWNLGAVGKTYTLSVSNVGGIATDGSTVSVIDTLPTGLSATAIAGTGWACTLGTLTCTRADALAPAGSYPAITVTVDVANNAPANMTNTATVSGGGETDTANDTASDPTKTMQVDLVLAKTHSGNWNPGDVGETYALTVSNVGAAATNGSVVSVVDTLPTGLSATAIGGPGWSCTLGTLTCTRSDVLAAGANYPDITVTVNVANNAAPHVTNTATVAGGGELDTSNDSASDLTTITQADLTVTKIHSGPPFVQGQVNACCYVISVKNTGTGPSSGLVTLVDALPTGLTAKNFSGGGWTCTLATLTCTRSDVLAAGSAYSSIIMIVDVAGNAPASVTNTATVSGGGELDTSNDSGSVTNPVSAGTPTPDLTIAKVHNGTFAQGDAADTYTITVSNSGSLASSGTVTVSDTVPGDLVPTGATGTGWSCPISGQLVTCTSSDIIAPGGTSVITLTVSVSATAAASVMNTATVSGGGETVTSNDSSTDVAAVTQIAPDLTITNTHTGNFVQSDSADTYTITVTNSGTGPSSGTVSVVDTVPSGLTASFISGPSWLCNPATVSCTNSGALAVNASYPPLTLIVRVAANAPSSVINSATVSGGGELNTANDTASDPTTIDAPADRIFADAFEGP